MAIVTKSSKVSMDGNTIMYLPSIPAIAAEALPAGSFCKLDNTGKAVLAADGDNFAGVNLEAKEIGEPVTLYAAGAVLYYADSGLTPDSLLYIAASANKGKLDTSAPTPGTSVAVAHVLDANHIRVIRNI